ncbi:MAG: hypothetical protein PHH21_01925 [Candidatus Pacebacteria bacterium]|nr:hypothetical protein [Candidatus Paceibacterota bacterium]
MAENNLPIEKAPTGGESNPFMGRNIENNPFKIDPANNPFKGYDRPSMSRKAPVKETTKTKEEPGVFKGAYGAARTKLLNWIIGRDKGYDNFRNFTSVNQDVRNKMMELRGRLVPKNREFINKLDFQREVNKMKREMTYLQGNDRIARDKFLKEVELKTGIKAKPY